MGDEDRREEKNLVSDLELIRLGTSETGTIEIRSAHILVLAIIIISL